MLRGAVLVVIALTAAGCGSSDDPFTADVKMICDAGRDRADLPPPMRRLQAVQDIAAKIRTPEAARLMKAMVEAGPADRERLMREAMARAGVSRCRFLEL